MYIVRRKFYCSNWQFHKKNIYIKNTQTGNEVFVDFFLFSPPLRLQLCVYVLCQPLCRQYTLLHSSYILEVCTFTEFILYVLMMAALMCLVCSFDYLLLAWLFVVMSMEVDGCLLTWIHSLSWFKQLVQLAIVPHSSFLFHECNTFLSETLPSIAVRLLCFIVM